MTPRPFIRIQLVQPRDRTYRAGGGMFTRTMSYAPLTLPLLAALIPPGMDAEISILDEGVGRGSVAPSADIVGITVLTATANRAYAIAAEARHNGAYVVMGGYHVTANPEEAMRHADTVITGMAERTWPEFLDDFTRGTQKKLYRQEASSDIPLTARPRRDLINARRYIPVETIQASRACPNTCSFCAVSHFHGARQFPRPVASVMDEIRSLRRKRVLFLDPNFHADRSYSRELMSAMLPLGLTWACLATVDCAFDADILRLMEQSGCMGVLVGFESICPSSLARINKGFNDSGRYQEAIRLFHEAGISVLGCLVVGFDEDDRSVFDAMLDFVQQSGMDLPRYSVLTPFPGTPLFEQLDGQGRITDRTWDNYDFETVVFRPAQMTQEELQRGLYGLWRKSFSVSRIAKRVACARLRPFMSAGFNLAFRRYGRLLAAPRIAL
jgi:radical SAM superfamily enzyme YgiQ (UPF0313 family)